MQRGSVENNAQRVRLYRMVEFIGRWSMVDVFVDTFTVALIQLQPLMSVEPAPGLFFFAAVVVLTMLAVESFDPRLIWDPRAKFKGGSICLTTTIAVPRSPSRKAVPKKRTRLSLVWVIPIVAAAAGVWVAVTKIMSEGPKITIVFRSAEGLEAGKTKIHYNGVDVGTLTAIRLSEDHQQVIATAQMAPKTEDFLVKDTKFWVVQPADLRRQRDRAGHADLRRLHRHGDRPVAGAASAISWRWRRRRW